MPDNKRHLGPENSFSPLLLLSDEDKPSAKQLVSVLVGFEHIMEYDKHGRLRTE